MKLTLVVVGVLALFSGCTVVDTHAKNRMGALIELSEVMGGVDYHLACSDSIWLIKNTLPILTLENEDELQNALARFLQNTNVWLTEHSRPKIDIKVTDMFSKTRYINSYIPMKSIVDCYIIETGERVNGVDDFKIFVRWNPQHHKVYGNMHVDGPIDGSCDPTVISQSKVLIKE